MRDGIWYGCMGVCVFILGVGCGMWDGCCGIGMEDRGLGWRMWDGGMVLGGVRWCIIG